MKNLILLAISCFIALPALAQNTSHARNDFSNIIGSVAFDLGGETGRAVLVDTHDGAADLYIYMTKPDIVTSKRDVTELVMVKKSIAFSPGFTIQDIPAVSVSAANGSIEVTSEYSSTGTKGFFKKITIAKHDGQFVVSRFTYNTYDRLTKESDIACDLDFLSRKGLRNKSAVPVQSAMVSLAAYDDENLPQECR